MAISGASDRQGMDGGERQNGRLNGGSEMVKW